MPIFLIINIPGATTEQYDQVEKGIGEPRLGEGQTYHVAGTTPDGLCVVDVWESRDHFERFLNERLGEQLQRAGIQQQPQITEVTIHNEVRE